MPPTPDAQSRPPRRAAEPHGLIVVTVDRLPAWMLSAWGATWVATPALDALAARGVLFDRVLVPSADPRETVRAVLAAPRGSRGSAVFEAAAARGWPAAVISDQPAVTGAVDLVARAEVTAIEPVVAGAMAADPAHTNTARLFDAAERIVAAGRHRAIWCHCGSLGVAWDAPEEFRAAYIDPEDPAPRPNAAVPSMRIDANTDPDLIVGLRHVFAGQLTLLDRCLGGLIEAAARAAGTGSGWIVLVIGLRGLPLGLHGWFGGGGDPADERPPFSETVHVPAILVDPHGRMAAQRYGGLVIPADLGATVTDFVGGSAAAPAHGRPWEGRSLAGLFDEWRCEPRDRVVIRSAAGDALVTPGWHVVDPRNGGHERRPLLFAKPDDFFERTDVADRCPEVAEELARALAAGSAADPHSWTAPLSPAALSAEA